MPAAAFPRSRRQAKVFSRPQLRGLNFQATNKMPIVISPMTGAATGMVSASAAVAAHPIEEKASAKVASLDDVWRRRNWLRRAWMRNQSWMAVAEAAATATPAAVTAACMGEANNKPRTRGANSAPMMSSTTSILARIARDEDKGAV